MDENLKRNYACAVCQQVGDRIYNGHAGGAEDYPDKFFCSEKCIEEYKVLHPYWREEKEARKIANTHNCWMRQCCPKEEWDKWAFRYDPAINMFLMGEFPEPYDTDTVQTITEGFKEGFKNVITNRKKIDKNIAEDAEAYQIVMSLLKNTKLPHGLCQPREKRACTNCNAREKLNELIENYKGRPIRFS